MCVAANRREVKVLGQLVACRRSLWGCPEDCHHRGGRGFSANLAQGRPSSTPPPSRPDRAG
jgi:hypothetical protein